MEGFPPRPQLRQSAEEPPFEPTPRRTPLDSGWRRPASRPWLARLEQPLWLLLLVGAVGLLFATAPQNGDFWWSDAPRHALNGVFLLDVFRALPFADPAGFAKAWYAQYPALSILFYPPLFALTEVPVYGLFGISHFSAQLTVALHEAALAAGLFLLARRCFSPGQAFAATLLFISFHEMASWGRQVMLEIPVYAWLVWTAVFYLDYLDTRRPKYLYGLALLALGALYTKQTAVFLVAGLAGLLVYETGGRILRDPRLLLTAAVFTLALIPLAVLTLKFGQTNLNAGTGENSGELSRLSWANWTYYIEQLPTQLGWPALGLALLYPLARRFGPDRPLLPPAVERLLAVWLVAGYLFFSLIALKEPRHSLLILLPLALFAIATVARWLPSKPATAAALTLAVGYFGLAVAVDRPPAIVGYDKAAEFVVDAAPARSMILFSGYRDGSFIFNLKARDAAEKLGVLRSDKLLLRVKVKRELGVEERGLTQEELSAALNRYGVSYVVNEPDFWNDLQAMRVLQNLLHTPQFIKVGEIPVTGNIPHRDRVLEVYRNLQYMPGTNERPPLELLIIDEVI
ncbi:glycosyltransferase family 39 protein [Methylomagnum sp.]